MKREQQELPEHLEAILEEYRRRCDQAAWQMRQADRAEREALGRMGLSHTSVAWFTLSLSGLVFLSVVVTYFCLCHG